MVSVESMEPFLSLLTEQLGHEVVSATPLSGGDTARAFKVRLDDDNVVFAKTHPSPPSPTFFATEARGLEWLRDLGHLNVPAVVAVADQIESAAANPSGARPGFLALEWIDNGGVRSGNESAFGVELAKTHRDSIERDPPGGYGRPDRATTGSLALANHPCTTWPEFYATNRLAPLVRIASDRSALPTAILDGIERIAANLDDVGAAGEPAVLVHGDLWAGNRLVGADGRSWVIDPAAHGGHREYDLAMMRLFGGFGEDCFRAYNDTFPLADGWKNRIPLHQLAPLLVHAIKFGGPYVAATGVAVDQVRATCLGS